MNNAELAQIRALLRASAPPERPRPRGPLGALRALLAAPATAARPSGPAARRVGLRPADDGGANLSTPDSDAALEARRRAFGQRQEGPPDPCAGRDAPGALARADADRRRGPGRDPAPPRGAAGAGCAVAGGDALPAEDLSDAADDAAQVYAEAGLFETQTALPLPEPALADEAQRNLLRRLEQVLLSEQAALQPPPRD